MIIRNFTYIRLNGSNISRLRNIGYFGKLHDIIKVSVDDLTINSHCKVKVKCDVCGKEKELKYQSYNNNINNGGYYSCSRKCAQNKIENTNIRKYNCKNPFQNEEIKEKIKKTLKNKYNVEHPMFSNVIKQKLIRTNLEKYGVEWGFKSNLIKDKIFQTMIKKYNCKYALQNKFLIKKMINSYDFEKGFKNSIEIKKYKDTDLYFQGSYEKDFLEFCETLNILDKIKNGKTYNYLEQDKDYGKRILTDFTIDDYEIEIKSTWIMKKQGGFSKVLAKKRAIESGGKNYIFILDKNYGEFKNIIK